MGRKVGVRMLVPHVVVIGGGFGGLYAVQALAKHPVQITLIDRRNHHLFQPLLYQVATAGLSPGNIAAPLRGILHRYRNVKVLLAEATDIDAVGKAVILGDGDRLEYDYLIIATGATHSYFGNDAWAMYAPGLKTIEDAEEIRRRVLLAYEMAERTDDPAERAAWLTFVVVGGGPTGAELAGALGEMAHFTLRGNFREIDPASSKVILVEAVDRILPPYPPDLSAKAAASLEKLGVTVMTNARVTAVESHQVTVTHNEETKVIPCHTVLWAAGVQASSLGKVVNTRTGAALDRAGRVMVEPDLSVAGYPDIFVIGDLAHYAHGVDRPLPGIAPVAMQQGKFVAEVILGRMGEEKPELPFRYHDRGSMATIGRAAAVAQIGRLHLSGVLAWLSWLFVHLLYLVGYDNRILVFFQWFWNYITYKRGVRLILNMLRPSDGEPVHRHRESFEQPPAPATDGAGTPSASVPGWERGEQKTG